MDLLSKEMLVVAAGGALGSVCRLLLSRWISVLIPYENLPWGIITVNIIGCFFIGILYVLFSQHFLGNVLWRTGLIIGVLGGFTTFSSFSLDTMHLLMRGSFLLAVSNILISVFFCLAATGLGIWLAELFV